MKSANSQPQNKKTKGNPLRVLFTSTFSLSAFTFGGGYVIVPLLKEKFVDELGWISEEEMLNYVVIAQSSPGALAVNAALLVGYRIAGFVGAMVALLGTILPPLITISIISFLYSFFRDNRVVSALLGGAQIGVAAVVTHVVIDMAMPFVRQRHWLNIGIMVFIFILAYVFQINVAIIIFGTAIFGTLLTLFYMRKERRD